jgi:hypothetical protein
MKKEPETIYSYLGFENLMASIYGWYGHNGAAAHKPVRLWKRELIQLFKTVRTAIEKNVTGDDRHKEYMMKRCDNAIDAIRHAKCKDEVTSFAAQFAFEINFLLLGRMPNNWQTRKAHHLRFTDLSNYRTLNYVRTDYQKAMQIIEHAFESHGADKEPSFEILIRKYNHDFSRDPHKFLSWIKAEHKALYDLFN